MGGWRGIGVSGSEYNEVLALEVQNDVLIALNERDVQSFLRLQRLLARSLSRRRSRRACARSYVYFVFVCV